jgi:hypothetical protein
MSPEPTTGPFGCPFDKEKAIGDAVLVLNAWTTQAAVAWLGSLRSGSLIGWRKFSRLGSPIWVLRGKQG